MRNGNNKRMRGRNNRGGGKGPNPLSRSYESNGPDVKIRGTAQHIAEKYLQLARDAHSSGDPVAAESYLQHAEHYFRIIAAAHEAQRQQQPRPDGQPVVEDEGDEDDDDDFASPFDKRFESPVFVRPEQPPQQNQQPRGDFGGQRDYQGQGRDYQGERRDFQGGERRDFQGQNRDRDRDRFPDRQDRPRFQDRQDRQDRPRFQQDAASGEQPDVQGAAPEGEGQRQDGRPYESRRERFERRRAERFAERQSRREGSGFDQDEGGEAGEAPRMTGDRPAAERPPVDRSAGREEETGGLGLPSFITGGAVSAPAPADDEAAPAPRPRKRRTPRVEDDAPVEAAEKTPAAE